MIIMVKSKSKNSYHFYDKPVKKSKPVKKTVEKKETVAFIPHNDPEPVLKKLVKSFKTEPTKTEECPCCVANCKCCEHKSGVGTGHTCTCRCHS